MKRLLLATAALAVVSVSATAKVFEYGRYPSNLNLLANADSFSVECLNGATGVIDRETVDVERSYADDRNSR